MIAIMTSKRAKPPSRLVKKTIFIAFPLPRNCHHPMDPHRRLDQDHLLRDHRHLSQSRHDRYSLVPSHSCCPHLLAPNLLGHRGQRYSRNYLSSRMQLPAPPSPPPQLLRDSRVGPAPEKQRSPESSHPHRED